MEGEKPLQTLNHNNWRIPLKGKKLPTISVQVCDKFPVKLITLIYNNTLILGKMIWYMFHYCLPVRWNELITFTFVLKPCNSSTSQRLIYNSIVTKKCMSRLSWINSLVMTVKQFALVHDQILKNYGDSSLFLLFTRALYLSSDS